MLGEHQYHTLFEYLSLLRTEPVSNPVVQANHPSFNRVAKGSWLTTHKTSIEYIQFKRTDKIKGFACIFVISLICYTVKIRQRIQILKLLLHHTSLQNGARSKKYDFIWDQAIIIIVVDIFDHENNF